MRVAVLTISLLCLVGCTDDTPSLRVDVRTDYVPVAEFAEVVVFIERDDGSVTERRIVREREDWLDGLVAATFDDIPAGRLSIRGELITSTGFRVASRQVVVAVTGVRAVTLIFSRICAAVICPGAAAIAATECLGGVCVTPECTPETPEECPPDLGCTTDEDCEGVAADCATVRCLRGICFATSRDDACAPGEWCRPETSCEPLPDVIDAGDDDAGDDDAGDDDAGDDDAGGDDAGDDDAGDDDAGDDDAGDDDAGDDDAGDAGAADTGAADTGAADTGAADTGAADTGAADTSVPRDTGEADTGSGVGDTGSAPDTSPSDAGGRDSMTESDAATGGDASTGDDAATLSDAATLGDVE